MKINNFEALNLNVNGNKQQLSNKTISKFFLVIYSTEDFYYFQACSEMVMPFCFDGVADMFEKAAW
jgi:hypothetical protein